MLTPLHRQVQRGGFVSENGLHGRVSDEPYARNYRTHRGDEAMDRHRRCHRALGPCTREVRRVQPSCDPLKFCPRPLIVRPLTRVSGISQRTAAAQARQYRRRPLTRHDRVQDGAYGHRLRADSWPAAAAGFAFPVHRGGPEPASKVTSQDPSPFPLMSAFSVAQLSARSSRSLSSCVRVLGAISKGWTPTFTISASYAPFFGPFCCVLGCFRPPPVAACIATSLLPHTRCWSIFQAARRRFDAELERDVLA